MNIDILIENIINNPQDFTKEDLKKYFNEYGKIKWDEAVDACIRKTKHYEEYPPRYLIGFLENVKEYEYK